jgi:hypothetical protein
MATDSETRSAEMKLAAFGASCLRTFRGNGIPEMGGDLDGGWLQEEAVRLGVLVTLECSEPCGEDCACDRFDVGETWTCYVEPDSVAAAAGALLAAKGGG